MSLHKNHELGKSISSKIENALSDSSMPVPSFTRLTGPGRSAIAVLMLQGDGAELIIERCFKPANHVPFEEGQIRYGLWIGTELEATAESKTPARSTEQPAESVVITPLADHTFEIHCHGGPAAVARIEADMRACHAISASDANRSKPSGHSLLIREAETVLVKCNTPRTAGIVMDQVRGALLDWANEWRTSVTPANVPEFRAELEPLLNTAATTMRLAEPFRVVLAGPPNVGKSSLLNALVGFDRSITLDMAGTTRDVLHANTVIAGLPIQFSDTAGIRDHAAVETIEREGIRQARLAAGNADLLLLVCEPLPEGGFTKIALQSPEIRQLRVLNKIDQQLQSPQLPDHLDDRFDVGTNALTGEGLAELMVTIGTRLGKNLPDAGKPALLNERQWKIMSQSSLADSPEQISELLGHLIGHNHG
jgi:tRNA modification GTPase